MADTTCAIRGAFFNFIDDPWKYVGHEPDSARFFRDGACGQERSYRGFWDFNNVMRRHPDLPVTHLPGRLILPGSSTVTSIFRRSAFWGVRRPVAGLAANLDFPEEQKYHDRDYARTAAGYFFDSLLAAGTTTCMAFTTSSPVSTEEFFDEAARRGMRVIAGLTGIDRFAPDEFLITPDDFYRECRRLIERYHRKGRTLYAITPRFAVGCTAEMMEKCRQLKRNTATAGSIRISPRTRPRFAPRAITSQIATITRTSTKNTGCSDPSSSRPRGLALQ